MYVRNMTDSTNLWMSDALRLPMNRYVKCNAYFVYMHTQLIVSCETQFVSKLYTPKIHQFDILYAI